MEIESLLGEVSIWDRPFFKQLANNDTGNAPGHQGGLVIPTELRQFFPGLPSTASAATPTVSRRLRADLFDGRRKLGSVDTRYQYQTWGGARSPESRLTDQLSELRNLANGGDYLVFQRRLSATDHYRLTLIRQGTPEHAAVTARTGSKRWGTLGSDPVTTEEYHAAVRAIHAAEAKPFSVEDTEAEKLRGTREEYTRTAAFRDRLMSLYGHRCSVCGEGLATPDGEYETEAAHVVPRASRGPNDARNGVLLCRRHHWSFDRGLFGIGDDRRVLVPAGVLLVPSNAPLGSLTGSALVEPAEFALRVHPDALAWHRRHVMLR